MSKYPPVLTKRDFTRRYIRNEFGNRAPTWDRIEDFLASDYQGLVHIRNRVAGGPTWYNIPADQVWFKFTEVIARVSGTTLYFSGMAPTEKTLIQGEVLETEKGLTLLYSRIAKPMREALAESSRSVSGILAVSLLRSFLCPNSYDWLMILLERYPFHVVEFSTYSTEWGTLPRFNSVFWEVRQY